MLTSIYYYSFYKPYIMSARETDNYAPRRSRIADKKSAPPASKGQDFVLNKSLKNEIVSYARNVSSGVNNLRSSTRKTQRDMENFNHLVELEGWDYALSSLSKDISRFANQYNESTEFLQAQKHSSNLRSFSNEITDHLYYNRDRLQSLGISFTEEGRINYDRSVLESMSHNQINIVIGENKRIFNDLQYHADTALTEPLVEHMNFGGLGYHYNYKLSMMKADGYRLLEAGILIDEVV